MTRKLKSVILPLQVIVVFILMLSLRQSGAFLTFKDDPAIPSTVGVVDVKVEVYFEKDGVTKTTGIEYSFQYGESADEVITKPGVYYVNISSINDIQYLPNLRVNLIVRSNVETYFRVAIYEQLTMLYTTNGITRETALTNSEYMPFGYVLAPLNQTDNRQITAHGFFDNRIMDGYIYYTDRVMRISENQPLVLPLIGVYDDSAGFAAYGERYRLQIGFIVDAVQAHYGPQMNWSMFNTPWRDFAGNSVW